MEKAIKKIINILVIAYVVLASFHLAGTQQAKKFPRIGFLGQGKPSLYRARIKALHQGLGEFGYVEGQNISFEYRYGEGKKDRLPSLAVELVRLEVDVKKRRLHLDVSDEELEERHKNWKKPAPLTERGYVNLYINHVQQSHQGADMDFLIGKTGSTIDRDSH